MGIVRVQSKTAGGNGTSLALTLDDSPLPAAIIIAAVATEGPNVISVVQANASWFQIAKKDGAPTESTLLGTAPATGAGTLITLNLSGSSSVAVVVCEYAGLTNILDLTSNNSATGSPARTGPTGITNFARELWAAVLSARHASVVFSNPANEFAIVDQVSGTGPAADGQRVALLDRIVDATGIAEAIADIAGPTLEFSGAIRTIQATAQTAQDPAGPSTPAPTVPEAIAKQDDHVGDGLGNLVQQFRSLS